MIFLMGEGRQFYCIFQFQPTFNLNRNRTYEYKRFKRNVVNFDNTFTLIAHSHILHYIKGPHTHMSFSFSLLLSMSHFLVKFPQFSGITITFIKGLRSRQNSLRYIFDAHLHISNVRLSEEGDVNFELCFFLLQFPNFIFV